MPQIPGVGAFIPYPQTLAEGLFGFPAKGSQSHRRRTPFRRRMRVIVRSAAPVTAAIRAGPARNRRRASTTARSVSGATRPGEEWGREDRSSKPYQPSRSQRRTHLYTVSRDTPISRATRDTASLFTNTRTAISQRPFGTNRALP